MGKYHARGGVHFVKNVWNSVVVSLIFTLLLLIAIRFVWGPGQSNPIYEVTGIYIAKVIYFTLYLIGFALAGNIVFWRFIKKLFSGSKLLTHTDSLEFKTRAWIAQSLVSFVSFIIITSLYFRDKSKNVFIGVDGDYLQTVNSNQSSWGGNFYEIGVNPLQGLGGNIWIPLNTRIDPGYFLGRLPDNFSYSLGHIGWATLLYLSTFLLTKRLGLKGEVVILSSWVVPFLIIFPSVLQLSTVPQLIPHMSTVIALNSIILASFFSPQNTLRNAMATGFLFSISVLGILLINPTFLILCIPLNFAVFVVAFKVHLSDGKTSRYLLTYGVSIGLLALPASVYLYGILKFSAVSLYPDDFIVGVKSNRAISSFFQLPGVAMVIATSLIGMILVSKFHKNKAFVGLARSVLILVCCLAALGFIYVRNPEIWDGPSPNYFEFMVWPIYGIFLSFVLVVFISMATDLARKRFNLLQKISDMNVVMSLIVFFSLTASFVAIPPQKNWEFPAQENRVLEELRAIAVKPGSDFKGREMTFTGLNLPNGISWNDLQKNDYVPVISNFGTDFRKADLWIRSIPTLTEYSQTISPTSYRLLLALLGKDGDKQVRNMMTLRRVSYPALAMLGVTMIVTDKQLDNLRLITSLASKSHSIFLYKIPSANLGDYSPTEVIQGKPNAYVLSQMKKISFDPKKIVFVSDSLQTPKLQKATASNLKLLRNGYRVTASSLGNSMLLLPVEFSSCWSLSSNKSNVDVPRIVRANFGLTGLVFNQSMDVNLEYKYSLFTNQSCRLSDLQKVK